VPMTAEGIEALASGLEPTDRVVMEVSSSAGALRSLKRHLARHFHRLLAQGPVAGRSCSCNLVPKPGG
jgi:hypothetical protein